MRKITLIVFATMLLVSNAPPTAAPPRLPSPNRLLHQELGTLTERGLSYRIVERSDCLACGEGKWVEAQDPRSGLTYRFPLDPLLTPRDPAYNGLPTLTIDLRTIDTNSYNWRFHYVGSVPLTGNWGFPLEVADFNSNERPEAYGIRQTQSDFSTRVYEMTPANQWDLRHTYQGNVGRINISGDIDGNMLGEVYARYGDSLFVFEQAMSDTIPTRNKFRHRQWYQSATGIPNQVHDMTGDGKPEILYRGSRPDTISPPNIEKTFVMTYDSVANNLRENWSAQLPSGCEAEGCTGAIATGDFDGDGKQEFVTSNFAGAAYVVEHVTGDSFAVTWSTGLSVAGRCASGDVDGNGTTEFFVGGTQAELDGFVHLRAYAFERTGNNTYQPVFAFNIFPAGIFFVDLYQTADVDGDNVPEFILSFAGGIMVIKGAGEHNYELFYHHSVSSLDGIAAWKIDNTGGAHLFVSRSIGSQQIISQTDVYSLDSSLIVGVKDGGRIPSSVRLFQNYPNPFNPSTTITYTLSQRGPVSLTVYDVSGKEVVTLVDEVQGDGTHSVDWAPRSLSSGIYFLRLMFDHRSYSNKIVYMK